MAERTNRPTLLQAAPDDAGVLAAGVPAAGLAESDDDVLAGAALSPVLGLELDPSEAPSDFAAVVFDAPALALFPPLLPPRKSVTYQPEPLN